MTRLLILGTIDTVVGATFATGSASRTSSRAYAQVKDVAPIHTWGLVLLAIGLALLTLYAASRYLRPQAVRILEVTLASAGGAWAAYWGVVLLETALADERVSRSGGLLWLLAVAFPHLMLALGKEG